MINKVILVGRLGVDPEFKSTQSGHVFAKFKIATNEKWKDRTGQWQEKTEWHKIITWGKLAEACSASLAKGKLVYIEGKLQTNQWEDKTGNKRYTTSIQAATVKFLDPQGKRENEQRNKQNDYDYGPPTLENDDELPF